VRIVVPMRIVVPVARIVSPLATLVVPEALAAESLFARATCRSRRQVSRYRRPNAIGRQTSDSRGRRRRCWRGWILFPVVVDGVDPAVLRQGVRGGVCAKVWRMPAMAVVILAASC
jgi:hypothetical protein